MVWEGESPEISARTVAEATAPILWFSPDEPKLGHPLPTSLPEDPQRPTAYFQIAYQSPTGTLETKDARAIPLKPGQTIAVRWFFYYAEDLGTNPHHHDLEGATFRLLVERRPDQTGYRLRLLRVKGYAHGLDWTANVLEVRPPRKENEILVQPDVVLPLTILVEEGKHASGPDRNADGALSPGYDINTRTNDAWGIRDDFGSGRLRGRYTSDTTKPRYPEDRMCPDLAPDHPLRRSYRGRHGWCSGGAYHLVAAEDAQLCPVLATWDDPECGDGSPRRCLNLTERLREESFCGSDPGFLKKLAALVSGERLTVGWRLDGEGSYRFAGSLLSVRLPGVDGWVGLRPLVALAGKRSLRGISLQYTPTASRWVDWYTQVGWEQFDRETGFEQAAVLEAGIKLRFPIEKGPLKRMRFAGVRGGIRNRGIEGTGTARLVWEVGFGAF